MDVSTLPTRLSKTYIAQPRLVVSLATYNEADNLRDLVAEIHQVAPARHSAHHRRQLARRHRAISPTTSRPPSPAST